MKKGIKNMSYCIHSFMCQELGLGGSELLVYAVIFSFSRGEKGLFYGTQQFLATVSGASLSTVKRALSSLLKSGLIEKCKAGKSEDCREGYRSTYVYSAKDGTEDEDAPSNDAAKDLPAPAVLERTGKCIDEFIGNSTVRPKYELLSVGAEGVISMTAEQYKRLLELVGSETLHAYIRRLELLILEHGYRTFSPYKTIKKWIYDNCSC